MKSHTCLQTKQNQIANQPLYISDTWGFYLLSLGEKTSKWFSPNLTVYGVIEIKAFLSSDIALLLKYLSHSRLSPDEQ